MKTIIKLLCISFFLGISLTGCEPDITEWIHNNQPDDTDTTQYKTNSVKEFNFEDFDEEFDLDELKNDQNYDEDQDLTPIEF